MKRLLLILILVVAALVPSLAKAQDATARYSLSLQGTSLDRALNVVVDRTGIDIAFSTELVAGKRVYCRVVEATLQALLRCVLSGTGLDYLILSSGTYVLREALQIESEFGVITGAVRDGQSGAPLAGAHVMVEPGGLGAVTNSDGRFAIAKVLMGKHRLSTTYLGYADRRDSLVVVPTSAASIEILLAPEVLVADPVVVDGLRRQLPLQQTYSDLEARPGSRLDPVRDVGLAAGLQVGDVLADVHLQGGDSGEHQFRLDGATVFVPLKLGGLVGPFSPLALGRIRVDKAGFGAGQGSHLSGIISAEHRQTNAGVAEVEALLDPFSASARVSGKVSRARPVHLMVAGRTSLGAATRPPAFMDQVRTWSALDPFLFDLPFQRLGDTGADEEPPEEDFGDLELDEKSEAFDLGYSDFHAAVRVEISPFRSWTFSGFRGRSRLARDIVFRDPEEFPGLEEDDLDVLTSRDGYTWKNDVLQSGYEWVAGSRTFVSIQSWWSSYRLDHAFDYDFESEDDPDVKILEELFGDKPELDRNEVGEIGLSATLTQAVGAVQTVTLGLESRSTRSSFNLTLPLLEAALDLQDVFLQSQAVRHFALHLNDRFQIGSQTSLDFGIRATRFDGRSGLFLEPRISIRTDRRLSGGGQVAVKLAGGLYRQFHHQVDVGTYQFDAIVPGYRVWMPVPGDARPPISYHLAGELLVVPMQFWAVGLEAYSKWTPHTLVVNHPELVLGRIDVEEDGSGFVAPATARSAGLSVRLRRWGPGTKLEVRYDYAHSERRIPGRFDDAFVQTPWNAPHRVFVTAELPLSGGFSLSTRSRFASGRTWGLHRGYYDYLGVHPDLSRVGEWDLTDPEAHRLPDVLQVDAGLGFSRRLAGAQVQMQVSVINVLDRGNIAAWSLDLLDESGQTERFSRTFNPRMPIASLRLLW